jgi:UDP-4-amino-4-deoxy-L-arabinose-oxoglutarate aminotransferase
MTANAHSQPWITDADQAAVATALAGGMIAQGETAARFETEMSRWLGAAGGVATASGGAALVLALRTLGVGAGDEVVLPTYVCRTVLDAIVSVGANPVLCDAGPDWVVRAGEISPRLTPRTRAVIVPHLYGLFADVAAIRALGVPVIEDAAQALGDASAHRVQGDLVALSFHPTKCLTTGEGGMLLSRDSAAVGRARELRDAHGARLSDLSAALGLSQLARYPEFLRRRAALAAGWHAALRDLPGLDLGWHGRLRSMFFRFPLHRAGGLDACQAVFAQRGVHVRRGVDLLLHRALGLDDAQFPQATAHFHTTVSLPLYPALTDARHQACVEAALAVFAPHA